MQTKTLQRRSILAAALAGAACLAVPMPALAHRKKRAITTIEWNANTNLLEVTHVLHLHDAEQALARLGQLKSPDLTPLRSRAQLALYAQKQFSISQLNGDIIDLNIVGAEIQSGQAYIYLEAPLKSVPKGLLIKNSLLQDMYLEQTNLVNVLLGTEVRSLTFFTGDLEKKVLA